MAYTRVFDVARPLGTVSASTLDDEIRYVRQDFSERISSIFGLTAGQFLADPIAPINLTLSGIITVARSINLGSTGVGTGGITNLTDDSGTLQWGVGILGSAGYKNYSAYNVVRMVTDFNIAATTGTVSMGYGSFTSILGTAPTSGNTSLSLYINDGAVSSSRTVVVGPADSGGIGFRFLRVTN